MTDATLNVNVSQAQDGLTFTYNPVASSACELINVGGNNVLVVIAALNLTVNLLAPAGSSVVFADPAVVWGPDKTATPPGPFAVTPGGTASITLSDPTPESNSGSFGMRFSVRFNDGPARLSPDPTIVNVEIPPPLPFPDGLPPRSLNSPAVSNAV